MCLQHDYSAYNLFAYRTTGLEKYIWCSRGCGALCEQDIHMYPYLEAKKKSYHELAHT
jgi:hypothetical protein